MADTESDLPDNSDNTASVPGDETGEVPAKKTEMTVPEMRQWL
ncbi:hypothetical protein, partial [Mycobacterium montefiorense]